MHDLDTTSLPDLVKPQEHQRRRRHHGRFHRLHKLRRRVRRINLRLVLIVILSVIAVVAMGSLVLVFNARSQVEDSWQGLSRVMNSINNTPGTELTLGDFERLQASVTELDQRLASAHQQTSFLRPLTFASADLDATLEVLDASREMTQAVNNMLNGLNPALFFLTEGEEGEAVNPQFSSAERLVELLDLGRGEFLRADEKLQNAEAIIEALQLAEVSPDILVTIDGLEQYHQQAKEINDIMLDAPDLLNVALGLDSEQSYLVLSANSDELRPSGGYISTYGWMTVRRGRIADYNYNPTTTTSPNPPPEELAREIQIPSWWIQYQQPIYAAWDSSWYADFPATAAMAAWYYDNGGNPATPVDGVLGIDIVGFEYILEGLGSVTVPDYGETVTPETFRQAVYAIRAEGSDNEHKKFVAALYQQILDDWQHVSPERNAELRGSILQALQEKHIMLYFVDERLNRAFDVLGWSGNQEAGIDQDYLMVADANLGSKSNRSVVRQTTYDVAIQPDGTLESTVSVAYDFPERLAEMDPAVRPEHYSTLDYHNILQVFTPARSTLISTDNLTFEPTIATSAEHTEFVSRLQVAYNDSLRVQYSYRTPELVERIGPYTRYRLLVQKQPGTIAEQVSVQVRLPVGAEVLNVSPEPVNSYNLDQPIIEFRFELTTDETIEILYASGE